MLEGARDARAWMGGKRHPRFRGVVIQDVKDPGVMLRHRVSEFFQDYNLMLREYDAVAWFRLWLGQMRFAT
jgi:hypothetical protein